MVVTSNEKNSSQRVSVFQSFGREQEIARIFKKREGPCYQENELRESTAIRVEKTCVVIPFVIREQAGENLVFESFTDTLSLT